MWRCCQFRLHARKGDRRSSNASLFVDVAVVVEIMFFPPDAPLSDVQQVESD